MTRATQLVTGVAPGLPAPGAGRSVRQTRVVVDARDYEALALDRDALGTRQELQLTLFEDLVDDS